ncbi:MAG: AAA family ATPase, partial [Pseudomonadota bacterium]
MPLNPKQQTAHDMATSKRISVITGAPGTGKTFTLESIHDWADSKNLKIIQAAPTGKAAKQMRIATGRKASTIHRMLDPLWSPTGFVFDRDEWNPIEADLIVLDECSMITTSLMASVVRAIDFDSTRLLMIGDHYQLPSVGAGAVLRDIIESGVVPVTELTEIQRNSGDIVTACHLIKDAKAYEPSEILDPENGRNLRHVECSSPELIHRYIKDIVCDRMPARGFNPVWDVQVLSPVNKRGILSCKDLNETLQAELNSHPRIERYSFRIGDKVIQTKNE